MSNDSVKSIDRIIDMIECFAEGKPEWGLVELSEKLDLPHSTTHRLLKTLVSKGYVEQNPDIKKYKIGTRLIWLSGSIISKYDLRSMARPYLQTLAQKTEETVHLCQLVGYETFYLDKIETPKSISCSSSMGMRLPAHVTSVGKTLLANLTEKELNNYFTTTKELKKYTKNTITDIENLKEYLKQVREQGYALDNEEVEEGLVCVAAPIFDLNKRAIAAISISGPEFRMKPDFQKYIPHAKDTAAAISRQIGYRN